MVLLATNHCVNRKEGGDDEVYAEFAKVFSLQRLHILMNDPLLEWWSVLCEVWLMSIWGPRCYEVRSFIDLWRIEIQIEMQTQYLMLLPSGAGIVLKFFTAQPRLLCKSTKTSTSRCFILKASDQANFMSISSHRPPEESPLPTFIVSFFRFVWALQHFFWTRVPPSRALKHHCSQIIPRLYHRSQPFVDRCWCTVCLLFVVIKSDSCAPLNIL